MRGKNKIKIKFVVKTFAGERETFEFSNSIGFKVEGTWIGIHLISQFV